MATELVEAPSLLQALRSFASLTETAIRARWLYRMAILMSLLVNALAFSTFYLVWSAVFEEAADAPSISRSELFGYLAITFILNFSYDIHLERRFEERLRQGMIVSDLLRPVGLMTTQLGHSVADVLTNVVLTLPLCAVAYWLFADAVCPRDATSASLGLLSGWLGLLIAVGVRYFVVQFAFVVESVHGVNMARMALHQAFSGLTAPLALFPPLLGAVAACLPFRHMLETPALIWLGRVPMGAVPGLLGQQAAWALALACGSALIYKSVLYRHQLQGG